MTEIRLYGVLAEEFGGSISLEIDNPKEAIDAIDANRSGFRKRVIGLSQQGFHYSLLVDKKKIETLEDVALFSKPKRMDMIPVLAGSGDFGISFLVFVLSTAASILLAPEPPKPPEISQNVASLEKSFTFSSLANRAAQGTPVPVGYGELIVGSEVIQTTLKSYPQNQRTFEAFRRNPFNFNENPTQASSQIIK